MTSLNVMIIKLAICICCAMSYTCNGYFGYMQSPMLGLAAGLAAGAVALDVVKSVALGLSANCLKNKNVAAFCAGLSIYIVGTVVSLAAAFGFYATLKDNKHGEAYAIKIAYTNVLKQHDEIKSALAKLTPPRFVAEIKADITLQMSKEIYWHKRRTNKCTNATLPQSKAFCDDLGKLNIELAVAQHTWPRIKTLQKRLRYVQRKLDQFDLTVIHKKSDAQIETMSHLSGVSEDTLKAALSILFAIAFEIGSGFGFYVFAASRSATIPSQPLHTQVARPAAKKADGQTKKKTSTSPHFTKDVDGLARFFDDKIHLGPESSVLFQEVFAAYQLWCQNNVVLHPLSQTAFAQSLSHRGFEKKRLAYKLDTSRPTIYHGLSLKQPKAQPRKPKEQVAQGERG